MVVWVWRAAVPPDGLLPGVAGGGFAVIVMVALFVL